VKNQRWLRRDRRDGRWRQFDTWRIMNAAEALDPGADTTQMTWPEHVVAWPARAQFPVDSPAGSSKVGSAKNAAPAVAASSRPNDISAGDGGSSKVGCAAGTSNSGSCSNDVTKRERLKRRRGRHRRGVRPRQVDDERT